MTTTLIPEGFRILLTGVEGWALQGDGKMGVGPRRPFLDGRVIGPGSGGRTGRWSRDFPPEGGPLRVLEDWSPRGPAILDRSPALVEVVTARRPPTLGRSRARVSAQRLAQRGFLSDSVRRDSPVARRLLTLPPFAPTRLPTSPSGLLLSLCL